MKFNITKIEIENFRSIQDKVTLNIKSGLFSIEGINYTETNSTNGSGKSTLISALFWALTGSSLTNEVLADEVVNLKTNKNCRVSVYISTDKDEIKVTRVRKDTEVGNNLFLEINGQDLSCHKVADTQDRINKLIKIPFDLLRNTIIMTSGMDSAFSSQTPQQRITTLESIRDYSIWEKLRDEANRDIKDYNNQIIENNSKISNITGSISVYTKMIESAKDKKEQLVNSFDKDQLLASIDTLVEKDGKIYGKPKDEQDAKRMLEELRNGKHNVITSLAVLAEKDGKYFEYVDYDIAKVYFKNIEEKEILKWLESGEALDKAGAYAIQGGFAPYISSIQGDYYNVVGLPACSLYALLKEL